MTPKLSVVINTFNEADVLPRVILSVKDLADEIVVVDTESTDNTLEVAKKLGAKVFNHKYSLHVEPVRNFAISKATGDWVLVLDPDEEVSKTLIKKIKDVIKNNQADFCRLPRKNFIFGHWMKYSRWWPDYNIRLFKKGSVSWNEIIHTVPVTTGRGIDFEIKEDLSIIHHHYDSVEKFISHMNRYTSVQADLKVKEGYEFAWRDLLVSPVNEFLSRYFDGEGYKDGLHGLSLSLLQAFSEFVLYLKVWQSEKFKEDNINVLDVIQEMSTKEKDVHFWQNDVLYKQTGSLIARLKKKLRI